jgi:hypothetical protein
VSEVIEQGIGNTGQEGERTAVASKGGHAVVQKYGREHMSQLGKQGSRAVVRKYGLRFYSEIAARNKGVKKRRAAAEA